MFDDFLEELRRREAEARGEEPEERPPRRPRPVGPDSPDGGRRLGRFRASWWVVILVVIVTIFVASAVLDLWTDALWFQSVGFDAVFWTRFGAQLGLFVAAALGSLAIILINLSIAGRLSPPSGGGRVVLGLVRAPQRRHELPSSRRPIGRRTADDHVRARGRPGPYPDRRAPSSSSWRSLSR